MVLAQPLEQLFEMKDALPAIVNAYQALGMKFETPAQAGLPDTLVYRNLWDFGPRLGAAYRLTTSNHPTVLRAGYSIFAYPESLRLFQGNTANTIPGKGTVSYNPNSAALSPDGLPNYLLRSVPTIVAGVNSSNALDANKATGIVPGGDALYFMDPHQPTARLDAEICAAKDIMGGVPIEIPGDKEIQLAVVIVIEESRGRGPAAGCDACMRSYIRKCAVAVVVVQDVAAVAGDIEIGKAVVVVIAGGHAHPVVGFAGPRKPRLGSDVGEGAIPILAIEAIPVSGIAARELRRQPCRVIQAATGYEKNVQ